MLRDVLGSFLTKFDFYLQLTYEHFLLSMLAIVVAAAIGLLLGILISRYQKSSGVVLTVINFIYTIPSISLLGLLIPLSGIGNKTAIIALIIYALLPMVRNTHTGIANIDPDIIEAARGMGSTDFQILYKIQLPLAFPTIMSGLRNMVTMTIALAGIASFIGAGGLGVAIYRGITTNNMTMTITGSLLIAIMALFMDFFVGKLEIVANKRKRSKKDIFMFGGSVAAIAIIVLASIFGGTAAKETIHIATKPMTEQYILGEMLSQVIEEETDLSVELTQGVGGGTFNIQPAMEEGQFDFYPEYTGTGWNSVLNQEGTYSEEMFDEMQEMYRDRYDMQWLGMYGFNNTFGIAIRQELADEYQIKTYSDLVEHAPNLTLGAQYDFFDREDGYKGLIKAYGLEFGRTVDLDMGLKYRAIQEGEIDVVSISTTDGQIGTSDIFVLEDDKNFYPSYLCGNVIRNEVLVEHPEIKDVLLSLENIIDDDQMSHLNYLVEAEGMEPKDVAKNFLEENDLL